MRSFVAQASWRALERSQSKTPSVDEGVFAAGTGRDYRLTWCLTPTGEWKIKA
jgi:hypothetical protein